MRLVAVCFAVLVVGASVCRAQSDRALLGITGAYSFGKPTAIDRKAGSFLPMGSDGTGSSWDHSGTEGIRLQLPTAFSDQLGLAFDIGFTIGKGEFKSNIFRGNAIISNGQIPTTASQYFVITSNYTKLDVEATLRYRAISNIDLGAGLWTSYRLRDDLTKMSQTTESGTYSLDSTAPATTPKFHFGIPLLCATTLQLSRSVAIVPEIGARIDLAEIARGVAQDAFSGGARLGILYELDAAPKEEAPKIAERHPARLAAAVHFEINGVSAQIVNAERTDTLHRQFVMLPTALDNATVAGALHASSAEEIGTRENFAHLPHSELRIIAERLRSLDSLHLTLTIAAASRSLADSVRDAILRNSPASVVRGASSSDDLVHLRSDPRVLAPYVEEWEEESHHVPNVTISKYLESEAGVRSWGVRIFKNGGLGIELHSDSLLSASALERVMQFAAGNSTDTVIALLSAIDNEGQHVAASDTLLVTAPNGAAARKAVKERFILLLDSTRTEISWLPALIARAARDTHPESSVRIAPVSADARALVHSVAVRYLSALQRDQKLTRSIHEESEPVLPGDPGLFGRAVMIEIVTPEG